MAKIGQTFNKYSIEFKTQVVEEYLAGKGGLKYLCKLYGIKSDRQLRAWIKKYQSGTFELANDMRGKTVGSRKGRPKIKFASKEEEWEYLRLENEYLKKKLLAQGESESFIANLWSSKNLK